MTRIFVQRGSSSNQSRSSSNSSVSRDDQESNGLNESAEQVEEINSEKDLHENNEPTEFIEEIVSSMKIFEIEDNEEVSGNSWQGSSGSEILEISNPPPPPPPPVPPVSNNFNLDSSRTVGLETGGLMGGSAFRRQWPVVLSRTSPSGSRSSSPRPVVEGEGYNSSDECAPCYRSSYDDLERERLFEIEIRRTKGLEVKKMLADGNCLFRAVADQIYGDPELYDLARHLCIDYMERERDHFSQFVTEGFTSYCRRKRRDKVYGNNVEIQAFCEMYNRPIHIYSYSTEPINIFHGNYSTDSPPVRLSYHHGNHYNSLVDPRRITVGEGLGFSSLRGTNVDKDQVKAAIKAQQERQIDNALLAEGRFYSDLELTEKEIERMVMENSRLEYQWLGRTESSTSGAQPSSSGGTGTGTSQNVLLPIEGKKEKEPVNSVLSGDTLQTIMSMGFSYYQVIEAYSMLGDNVEAIVGFLLDMDGNDASSPGTSRRKGKAATE